jgi:hypothetical protein
MPGMSWILIRLSFLWKLSPGRTTSYRLLMLLIALCTTWRERNVCVSCACVSCGVSQVR